VEDQIPPKSVALLRAAMVGQKAKLMRYCTLTIFLFLLAKGRASHMSGTNVTLRAGRLRYDATQDIDLEGSTVDFDSAELVFTAPKNIIALLSETRTFSQDQNFTAGKNITLNNTLVYSVSGSIRFNASDGSIMLSNGARTDSRATQIFKAAKNIILNNAIVNSTSADLSFNASAGSITLSNGAIVKGGKGVISFTAASVNIPSTVLVDAGVSGNVTITTTVTPFVMPPVGTIKGQCGFLTIQDPAKAPVTTSFDQTKPLITCPGDMEVPTASASDCVAVVNFNAPTATDNCPVLVKVSKASGTIFPAGTTTVLANATDGANIATCSFNVKVTEKQAPTITCPANIEVAADKSGVATVDFPAAMTTDNCPGVVTTATNLASGDAFPIGTTVVTATATDASGNKATCEFTIKVSEKRFCFSSVNIVEVQGKGHITMDALQIGDYVRAGKDRFSQVYSFLHLDRNVEAEYLQIYTDSSRPPLEISRDHMVFVNGIAILASQVEVGDLLDGGESKVSEIKSIRRRGVYAPVTMSGDIIVSGVLASSYAAVHSYTPINQHLEAHAFFAFRRLVCALDFEICKSETYTEEGFPDWLSPVIHFALRTEHNPLLQACASVVGLPFIAIVSLLEQMVLSPLLAVSMIVFVLFLSKKHKPFKVKPV